MQKNRFLVLQLCIAAQIAQEMHKAGAIAQSQFFCKNEHGNTKTWSNGGCAAKAYVHVGMHLVQKQTGGACYRAYSDA